MKKKKITKKKLIIAAVAVMVCFSLVQYFSSKKTEGTELADTSMEMTYVVEKTDMRKIITGTGQINPSDIRIVSSDKKGTVGEVFVREGQMVDRDEMLARYEIESDDESKQLKIDSARYDLALARKNLDDLKLKADNLKIYADEKGAVSFFNDEGDMVSEGMTLGELSEVDILKVQSYFTGEQLDSIYIGDKAEVFLSDYLITLEGKIVSKDNVPVANGGGSIGYLVEAEIEYEGALKESSPVKITVVNSTGKYTSPFTGESIPKDKIAIKAEASGVVKKVHVGNGDLVEKGQLIAELESDDLEYRIAEQKLFVEQKRLNLNELDNESSSVDSPIAGTILNVFVDEQGYVEPGAQLFEVADLEDMEVVLGVDELDIMNVFEGQKVSIDCPVFADEEFTGVVESISLKGNGSNGVTKYDVTVSIDDRKKLMAGMNVNVEVEIADLKGIVAVPVESVSKTDGEYFVTVMDGEGNRIEKKVGTGIANNEYIEITSGLEIGDTIYYEVYSMDMSFDSRF
ncbi:RND family efflux transporter, MFP subunit [Dethiosulfatibacter aminovorans DSM 17477]|uniref:RND family efflux transporter, MFP subunit n=1 Tax=Dethiosulfatibacter aminovorans DSM 17477 TaxID=1121476 RepID=A0A1M6KHX0_9FIRM|nr:HlyD family efflux transporter periplasmic adaptor subunit [Dethiosulfatibacter aminovorans]SHJ58525.1 RND family efflux transporter, MFP subunit [Dethiosulfatibacter aminovorans DSM 17477]